MANRLNFNQCTLPMLDRLFGLRRTIASPVLDEWLYNAAQIQLSPFEQQLCAELQSLLQANTDSWHEQELSLHFIGPLFGSVKFTELYRYNLFAQRPIEAPINDYLLSGEPDGLIASGYYEPEIPYFAFAEYKRHRDPSGDPAGQALAAMLVGQVLNQRQQPVYPAPTGILWSWTAAIIPLAATSPAFPRKSSRFCASSKRLKSLSLTSRQSAFPPDHLSHRDT